MRLLIVSGRSGSGKSTALQALEDQGLYCVDNLPLGLLPSLAAQVHNEEHRLGDIAVGVDARNLPSQLPRFRELLEQVRTLGIPCEVIFLDADHDTLIKRYSSTRRRHPLDQKDMSLSEAIRHESHLLADIQEHADLVIDTSNMDPHSLRNLIRERLTSRGEGLSLLIQSFGYMNGIPSDADLVWDVRMLPNPHWHPELRPFTGRDQAVADFLDAQQHSQELLDEISGFLERWLPRYEENDRMYMTLALGCTGGQHRSVYMAERLTQRLRSAGRSVQVRHREL